MDIVHLKLISRYVYYTSIKKTVNSSNGFKQLLTKQKS